jgi:hypothetical protein
LESRWFGTVLSELGKQQNEQGAGRKPLESLMFSAAFLISDALRLLRFETWKRFYYLFNC